MTHFHHGCFSFLSPSVVPFSSCPCIFMTYVHTHVHSCACAHTYTYSHTPVRIYIYVYIHSTYERNCDIWIFFPAKSGLFTKHRDLWILSEDIPLTPGSPGRPFKPGTPKNPASPLTPGKPGLPLSPSMPWKPSIPGDPRSPLEEEEKKVRDQACGTCQSSCTLGTAAMSLT